MLYLVATPIGNLKDVTLRALEVLNSVDFIACEDTRHSATFLSAHGIKKPLVAYHKFNEKEEGLKLVEELKSGKNVALPPPVRFRNAIAAFASASCSTTTN